MSQDKSGAAKPQNDNTTQNMTQDKADDTITAEDLKGVAAVPKDGGRADNRSGADASDPQGDEVDPGAG